MCQQLQREDDARAVMNGGNKPIIVSLNVKHRDGLSAAYAERIRMRICPADLRERAPVRMFDDFRPRGKPACRFRMLQRPLLELFFRDNPHVLHFAIKPRECQKERNHLPLGARRSLGAQSESRYNGRGHRAQMG